MKKLNWDYIHHCIKERTGYSLSKYSQVKLGRSESYLSQCKNGGFNLSKNALDYMIKDLGLEEDALWQTSEMDIEEMELDNEMTAEEFAKAFAENPKPAMVEKAYEADPTPVLFYEPKEDRTEALLEEINTKLDMVLELEEKLNNLSSVVGSLSEKVYEPKESTLDMIIRMAQTLKGVSA